VQKKSIRKPQIAKALQQLAKNKSHGKNPNPKHTFRNKVSISSQEQHLQTKQNSHKIQAKTLPARKTDSPVN